MAALILIDGWTAHSMLGIPIPINEASFSYIKKNSEKADMLRQTSLIIWYEAAMQSRLAIEAVDRSLRDFLDQPLPFGGITVAFGGDFQQTLPIIPKVRYQITNGSLTKSILLHPFSATPPLIWLHSISVPSPTLPHSSLFSPCFTLHPCLPVSLISFPMLLWSSHLLHIVSYPIPSSPCFMLVPLFLVPD